MECTGNPYMLLCFLFKIATVLDFDISKDVSMNFQLTSSRTAICLSLFFWSLRQWLVVLELLTNWMLTNVFCHTTRFCAPIATVWTLVRFFFRVHYSLVSKHTISYWMLIQTTFISTSECLFSTRGWFQWCVFYVIVKIIHPTDEDEQRSEGNR